MKWGVLIALARHPEFIVPVGAGIAIFLAVRWFWRRASPDGWIMPERLERLVVPLVVAGLCAALVAAIVWAVAIVWALAS